ncbi:MAG: indole-3-glycerol phosphate synthase TrpC [Cyanobacteria bacterium REEB67]|nr:indole-3-glycerol phosphate synthase TrpC [Cyanobacteria bacterium REEB67]
MTSQLTEIVENKKAEVALRKAVSMEESKKASTPAPVQTDEEAARGANFVAALQKADLNLICELKPKSPSAGVLKADFNPAEILPHYQKEAAAISVLTDSKYFGGSLALLAQVAENTKLPLLCKDFIIDPFQCQEAVLAGASAILIMVKILDDESLSECHTMALSCGLAPVVEVQNEAELERALKLDPKIILINNRNLDTFIMDMETTARLAPLIPDSVVKISASGYSARAEIEAALPYSHNFLIGSSLMTTGDIVSKLQELKGKSGDMAQGKKA